MEIEIKETLVNKEGNSVFISKQVQLTPEQVSKLLIILGNLTGDNKNVPISIEIQHEAEK